MSKANKWLAVLCASASAISTVSVYNSFFSSNTADQISHETAKQEPPNKPCELENTDADAIISDFFRPEHRPGVKPPPRGGGGDIALPLIKRNIDICRKKSQKLQIEDIIKNELEPNNSDKKVNMPDIPIPNLKINYSILGQQSKDFVSYMNEHFAISGKKVRKEYAESVASRLEFVNHSKKDSTSQHIKDFSQHFNNLIPDSETKDFVTIMGGTNFQKGIVDNDVINNIISQRGEEKSNYQKIREISEQFDALSKDLVQNDTYDSINIDILKKQKLQESDSETSKIAKEKSNYQKIREISEQFDALSKDLMQNDTYDSINIDILKKQKLQESDSETSKIAKERSNDQKVKDLRNQLSGNACKNTGDSDSLSTDGKALRHSNYSFDDDNSSSSSMLNVKTDDVILTIFNHDLRPKWFI